jgi:hypothetical protein
MFEEKFAVISLRFPFFPQFIFVVQIKIMKIVDWNIICKTIGRQLSFVFLLGTIASADYFLADALEKLGFSLLLTAIVKGVAIFAAIYYFTYALMLMKKIVEKFY